MFIRITLAFVITANVKPAKTKWGEVCVKPDGYFHIPGNSWLLKIDYLDFLVGSG